jgi:hypothetical protein
VKVAFNTDDPITNSRLLLRSAALAVRGGMSEDAALKGLTIYPAEMLDLQSRVGSLEVGKDADFIVLSGAPLSVYTHVLETWIEGEKVFDRSNPVDLRYATGGFQVIGRYPQRRRCAMSLRFLLRGGCGGHIFAGGAKYRRGRRASLHHGCRPTGRPRDGAHPRRQDRGCAAGRKLQPPEGFQVDPWRVCHAGADRRGYTTGFPAHTTSRPIRIRTSRPTPTRRM